MKYYCVAHPDKLPIWIAYAYDVPWSVCVSITEKQLSYEMQEQNKNVVITKIEANYRYYYTPSKLIQLRYRKDGDYAVHFKILQTNHLLEND